MNNIRLTDYLLIPLTTLKAKIGFHIKPAGSEKVAVKGNTATTAFEGKAIRLSCGPSDVKHLRNMTIGTFIRDFYKGLDVKNKVVLDIGASFGDTALYFACKGAKHIYALEPDEERFRWLKKNLKLNRIESKVTAIKEGYGKLTLKELINRYRLGSNLVLKLDCEGAEYNLLNESEDTLRHFPQIEIEYHQGYVDLVKFLGRFFSTATHTIPVYMPREKMYIGVIRCR